MNEGTHIRKYLKSMASNMRLFRINAGVGWVGKIVKRTSRRITLENYRPLHAAPPGWPDLAGWTEIEITPDMVGQKIAVFTGKEFKPRLGRLRREQKIFGNVLERMGGDFSIVRRD
jgi:hypothetical protein